MKKFQCYAITTCFAIFFNNLTLADNNILNLVMTFQNNTPCPVSVAGQVSEIPNLSITIKPQGVSKYIASQNINGPIKGTITISSLIDPTMASCLKSQTSTLVLSDTIVKVANPSKYLRVCESYNSGCMSNWSSTWTPSISPYYKSMDFFINMEDQIFD